MDRLPHEFFNYESDATQTISCGEFLFIKERNGLKINSECISGVYLGGLCLDSIRSF
jgi:hypothetical protein